MLVHHTGNPCPDGAHVRSVTTADGLRLRTACWLPAGQSVGTALILQGRAEWIEKYFETITDLLARRFAVICFDWRGQGGSDRLLDDPLKGHIDDFDAYHMDLSAVRAQYAPLLQRPLLVLAHSMGGMVLLRALHQTPDLARAAILTAPMFGIALLQKQPWLKGVIRLCCLMGFKHRYPPVHRSHSPLTMMFERNPLTRDRMRFERTQASITAAPHFMIGMPTLGWLNEAMRAIDEAAQLAADLRSSNRLAPVWIFAPLEDRVTATDITQRLCAGIDKATLVELAECEHEVLLETDTIRQTVWQRIDQDIMPLFAG